MMWWKKLVLGTAALSVASGAVAADEKYLIPKWSDGAGTISTDRPAFSNTANTVAPGHVIVETGYTFTHDDKNDARLRIHTIPELLGRVGLTDWLELRAQWAGQNYFDAQIHGVGSDDFTASGDMTFGVKARVLRHEQGNNLPNLSIIASVVAPTGSDLLSADAPFPDIRVPWNYPITEQFTVYGSLVGRVPDYNDGRFFQGGASLAGSYFFTPCTGLYLEYFGLYPAARSNGTANLLSAGPIFKVFDDFQIDLRASAGLDDETPDFQSSVGLSFLF